LLKHTSFRTVFTILVTGLILFQPVNASAQGVGDFQVWNETTLIFPVVKETDENGKESDKLALLILGTLRLGQNRLYPVDARVGAGFDLKLNKYFSFTPTYVYRRGEPFRNVDLREFEHRLRFDLTVGNKWKDFSLKHRTRVEYRIRNSRRDSVRYRNKFTFALPVRKDDKEIFSPYVAEELYYDFSLKALTTNEITAGIARKLSKDVSAEFFYVRRDVWALGARAHINGIGSNIKIRID
jgi:hypothetical protein